MATHSAKDRKAARQTFNKGLQLVNQIVKEERKLIPLGKITLLDGDPCMGKSMLALNLAASVSSVRPMPDGTPSPQGGVILIAPEDGAADTLKPRLEAAGGDPSCVLLLNTVESLDAKNWLCSPILLYHMAILLLYSWRGKVVV